MTTHEEREISLCNRIFVMRDGKLSEAELNSSIEVLVNKL